MVFADAAPSLDELPPDEPQAASPATGRVRTAAIATRRMFRGAAMGVASLLPRERGASNRRCDQEVRHGNDRFRPQLPQAPFFNSPNLNRYQNRSDIRNGWDRTHPTSLLR